jgi:Beta propeller domain
MFVTANAMEEGEAVEQAVVTTSSKPSVGPTRRRVSTCWILAMAAILVLGLALTLGLFYGLRDGNHDKRMHDQSQWWNNRPSRDHIRHPSNELYVNDGTQMSAISPETLLQSYTSCDDLALDLKSSMRLIGRRQIDWNVGNYNKGDGMMYTAFKGPSDMSSNSGDGAAPSEGNFRATCFDTDNSLQDVQEPDIVQSNGQQVFVVYGSEILELDATTSTLMRRTLLPVDCYQHIQAMLLVGDRLLVIAAVHSTVGSSTMTAATNNQPIVSLDDKIRIVMYAIDTMEIVSDESVRGGYIDSRAIGPNVHLVTSTHLDTDRLLQFIDPYVMESSPDQKLSSLEYQARAESELEQRLDAYTKQLASELDCANTQKLAWLQNTNDQLDLTSTLESVVTIFSVSVTAPTKVSTRSIFIPRRDIQVYSTNELLILAIGGWWVADPSASPQTYLMAFRYQNASILGHALGSAPGYVLTPLSLQHTTQNGTDYLRVATSTQSKWMYNAHGIWNSNNVSMSQVSILDLYNTHQGYMPLVGKVVGLGKSGEQIYSVQFIGDLGFVCTYKQTDPLFTLDLRDPINPKVGGELEISGYLSYLHFAGDNLILSVDKAADATGSIQISLFDVSDVRNPQSEQNLLVGHDSSSSLAIGTTEYDYKASRYFLDHGLLIIPMTYYESVAISCEYYEMHMGMGIHGMYVNGRGTGMGMHMHDNCHGPDDSGSGSVGGTAGNGQAIRTSSVDCWNTTGGFDGFRIFTVSTTAGIRDNLTIKHASDSSFAHGCWSSAWLPPRSIVLEGDIITVKGHSILIHDLTALKQISAVVLDKNTEVCHPWIYS